MKKIVLITILLITVVSTTAATTQITPNLARSAPLTEQEMTQLVGSGCDELAGGMVGLAFTSGYFAAICPVASAAFLGGAGAIGLTILIFC